MTNMDADLALIKLKRDLALDDPTKHMTSICIPEKQEENQIAGHSCIVSGWGAENGIDELYSDVLNKASMEVWKQDACRKRYQTVDEYMKDITEGMICFGDNGKSTCDGDEGGPLSCELDGRWYLYGVASWQHYLCDGNVAPSVDTRVSQYSKWIWQTIKLNS